jgi:hypothetical protein
MSTTASSAAPTDVRAALKSIGQVVRRPEQLALAWRDGAVTGRTLIILAMLGTAAFGLAVYGGLMRMHDGPASMLAGALRAPIAAGLAWTIALPALYIVGSSLGSQLSASTTLLAASITVAFGSLAMLAGVPIAWFFSVAVDDRDVHLLIHALSFAGVGVCMADVFLRVMAALEPEGGTGFRIGWLMLLGVIGLELFIVFNVFGL